MASQETLQALGLDWPELREPMRDVARLTAQRQDNEALVRSLRDDLERAEESDRIALSTSLLNNEGREPEPKAGEVADELEKAQRRAQALNSALDRARSALRRTVEEHSDQWRHDLLSRLPSAQDRVEKAAKEMLAAVGQVNALAGLYAWLQRPEGGTSRRPLGTVRVGGREVPVEGTIAAVVAQARRIEAREPTRTADSLSGKARDIEVRI